MAGKLTPLGELIQARLDATGWSRRQLERESGISKTQLGNYMQGPMTDMPRTESIRRLTAVLAVPERIVVAAALETVNLAHPGGAGTRSLEEVIEEQAYLDDTDKQAFKAWVKAKRRA